MPHDVISTCPVCSSELAVTRLHCRSCGTTLEGDFSVGRFGRVNRDQMAILESFLRARGNLRDMERELGISYPTVRSRVEALVRALGFGPRDGDDAADPEAAERAAEDLERAAEDLERAAEDAERAATDLATARADILGRLSRHEISAEDAANAIRGLGRTR